VFIVVIISLDSPFYYFLSQQWRSRHTEEGIRGLKPLPLAYDLRNKRARKRQNMVFSTKNTKNFLGRGRAPFPDPSPSGEGDTPHPLGACSTSTPPFLKFWVLGTPLYPSPLPCTVYLHSDPVILGTLIVHVTNVNR